MFLLLSILVLVEELHFFAVLYLKKPQPNKTEIGNRVYIHEPHKTNPYS